MSTLAPVVGQPDALAQLLQQAQPTANLTGITNEPSATSISATKTDYPPHLVTMSAPSVPTNSATTTGTTTPTFTVTGTDLAAQPTLGTTNTQPTFAQTLARLIADFLGQQGQALVNAKNLFVNASHSPQTTVQQVREMAEAVSAVPGLNQQMIEALAIAAAQVPTIIPQMTTQATPIVQQTPHVQQTVNAPGLALMAH